MIRTTLIILFLFTFNSAYTQDKNKPSSFDSTRSNYIEKFNDRFFIKPLFTARSLSLQFTDTNRKAPSINYSPSSNNFLGFGVFMFGLNVELSFKLPQSEHTTPPEIYGETDSFDFQTNIYAKKWGADIAYQEYTELYLKNPTDHLSNWNDGDPYPIRGDMDLRYIQASGFYIFNNEKFSIRSPYIQSERQKSSQGSVLTGMLFSHLKVAADSSLIPIESQEFFPEITTIKNFNVTAIAASIGYTYTLTYKNFYINATANIGPGYQWTVLGSAENERTGNSLAAIVNLRGAFGYNGDWFFIGASGYGQIVSSKVKNIRLNSNSTNTKFFLGFRFNEYGFLKRRIFGR